MPEDKLIDTRNTEKGIQGTHFFGQFSSLEELEKHKGSYGSYAFVDGIPNVNEGGDTSGNYTAETPSSIKTKYESNTNTNAFTDSEKAKLSSLGDRNSNNGYAGLDENGKIPISIIPGDAFGDSGGLFDDIIDDINSLNDSVNTINDTLQNINTDNNTIKDDIKNINNTIDELTNDGGDLLVIPKGTVWLWYGNKASFNVTGWAIMDGSYNATWGGNLPDMSGKFPKGASSTSSSAGTTGGSNTVTLTISNLPSHNHTIAEHLHDITHNHGGSVSSHEHGMPHNHGGSVSSHYHSETSHSHTMNHSHTGGTGSCQNAGKHHTGHYGSLWITPDNEQGYRIKVVGSISPYTTGNLYTMGSVNVGGSNSTVLYGDGSHTHNISVTVGTYSGPTGSASGGNTGSASPSITVNSYSGNTGSASPSITVNSYSGNTGLTPLTTANTGSGTPLNIEPAFMEFYYILKII